MKKSKFVFAIMTAVYLGVAIAGSIGWLTISENILLGLSLSALLSAASDILNNVGLLCAVTNEFNYIIRTTVAFLEDKISKNSPIMNSNINVRNVKRNVESMSKNYEKAIHPNEYCKKRSIKLLFMLSQMCFIISIGVFILVPFLPIQSLQSVSTFLTLLAFAAMSCNLHISEAVSDKSTTRNCFLNNEQLIIQTTYPDFSNILNAQLYYHEDYIAATSTQEGDLNAHA